MKYPLPMRALHWIVSIIILTLLAVGIIMTNLPDTATYRSDMYFWHKSFGMLILGLFFIRVFVRAKSNVPPPQPGLARWEVIASHAVHYLLYALIFLVPFAGYCMSSAYIKSSGVSFFGLFTFPNILPKNDALYHFFAESHEILAYTLLAIVVLHVAAVIKHRYFDKNDVLKRML